MATTDLDQTLADDASCPQPEPANEARAAAHGLTSDEACATAEADPGPSPVSGGDSAPGPTRGAHPAEGCDPAPGPAAGADLAPGPAAGADSAAAADPAPAAPASQVQATTARDLFTGPRARAFALLGGVVLLVLVLALSPLPAWLGGLSQSSAFQTVADTAPQAQTDVGQGSPATAKAAAGTPSTAGAAAGTPTTAKPADSPAATTATASSPAATTVSAASPASPAAQADDAVPAEPEAAREATPEPAPSSEATEPAALPEPPAPGPAPVDPEPAPAAEPKLVHVTVVIDGTAAGEQYYSVHVELEPGQTAYDALVASGANVNARATVYGTYVAAIDGLAEMAHGPMSGWVYAIDGVEPNVAASGRIMRDGQTLVWTYVNVEY